MRRVVCDGAGRVDHCAAVSCARDPLRGVVDVMGLVVVVFICGKRRRILFTEG